MGLNSSKNYWYLVYKSINELLQLTYIVSGNASICNPWVKSKFLQKMKTISDGLCEYCLPDCNQGGRYDFKIGGQKNFRAGLFPPEIF